MPRAIPAASAQRVDPLTWLSAPYLPLALAVLSFVCGGALSIASWSWPMLPVQLGLVGLSSAGCALVYLASRPLRRPIGWALGSLALGMSVAAQLLSALTAAGSAFAIEHWWAPISLALTILCLGPYLAPRWLAILGVLATVVASTGSLASLLSAVPDRPSLGLALAVSLAPTIATVASVVFSAAVVRASLAILESRARTTPAGDSAHAAARGDVERVTVTRLTSGAASFLESIASAGRITPADRAVAERLARKLRDELVAQSNLTWLDSMGSEPGLAITDPDGRASRMNGAQRSALRGLLRALRDAEHGGAASLAIELRAAQDGATMVAINLDSTSRQRMPQLAAHYLTLGTAVDDLTFDRHRAPHLSFRVSANEGGRR